MQSAQEIMLWPQNRTLCLTWIITPPFHFHSSYCTEWYPSYSTNPLLSFTPWSNQRLLLYVYLVSANYIQLRAALVTVRVSLSETSILYNMKKLTSPLSLWYWIYFIQTAALCHILKRQVLVSHDILIKVYLKQIILKCQMEQGDTQNRAANHLNSRYKGQRESNFYMRSGVIAWQSFSKQMHMHTF